MTEPTTALALPEEGKFRADLVAIRRFQAIAQQEMREGSDWGAIPGTGGKPTLLKPGAEKIVKLLGLTDDYELLSEVEDWEKGFFAYKIKCRLTLFGTSHLVSAGVGECNSMEAKYRWREGRRKCPVCNVEAIIKGKDEYGGGWLCYKKQGGCGAKFSDDAPAIISQPTGRVPNEDIYSQVNTILKMAKKRALVDAALSAGRLSEVFTQDIEDMSEGEVVSPPPPKTAPQRPPEAPTGGGSPAAQGDGLATEKQRSFIGQLIKKAGWTNADLAEHIATTYPSAIRDGKGSTQALTIDQASEVINYLKEPAKKTEEGFPDD